eukprot:286620-Pelagomonas_calceolata.AAC.5
MAESDQIVLDYAWAKPDQPLSCMTRQVPSKAPLVVHAPALSRMIRHAPSKAPLVIRTPAHSCITCQASYAFA